MTDEPSTLSRRAEARTAGKARGRSGSSAGPPVWTVASGCSHRRIANAMTVSIATVRREVDKALIGAALRAQLLEKAQFMYGNRFPWGSFSFPWSSFSFPLRFHLLPLEFIFLPRPPIPYPTAASLARGQTCITGLSDRRRDSALCARTCRPPAPRLVRPGSFRKAHR
jgi:hypothetical protein